MDIAVRRFIWIAGFITGALKSSNPNQPETDYEALGNWLEQMEPAQNKAAMEYMAGILSGEKDQECAKAMGLVADGAEAEQVSRPMIEEKRINEITEIGTIDGGEDFDVLVVSYGPNDRRIRARDEHSGIRTVAKVPPEAVLEDCLDDLATTFMTELELSAKPSWRVYRGHQARKWAKRLIHNAEIAEQERTGDSPQRLTVNMPHGPNSELN